MEQRFASALGRLQNLLKDASVALRIPIRFALIGGLAVSAWGVVRATQDIDLLADSIPSPLRNLNLQGSLQKFWEKQGCRVEWRTGAPDDPIPLLLHLEMPGAAHGLQADILWAHKRWQREALARTITLRVLGFDVFVLHPEALVLMKLEAGGPQDLLDVEALLSTPPPELNLTRLKQKATQLRLGARLNRCLHPSKGRKLSRPA